MIEYKHLPETVSKPIGDLAKMFETVIPDNAESMRKLFEAKDCFVRAMLP